MTGGTSLRLSEVHAAIAAKEGQCITDIAMALHARPGFVKYGIEVLIMAGAVGRVTHKTAPYYTYSTIDGVSFEDAAVAAPEKPPVESKPKPRANRLLRLVKTDADEKREPLSEWQQLEFTRRKAADRIAAHAIRLCVDEGGKDPVKTSALLAELAEAHERAARTLKTASLLALKPSKIRTRSKQKASATG